MNFRLRYAAPRLLGLLLFFTPLFGRGAQPMVLVGAARIDITPELPILMSGYNSAGREAGTTHVERRLHARALAIGDDANQPVVLITAEIIGVSEEITNAVADALRTSHGIARDRVAVCTTHTHTGPMIRGVLPFMYGKDLPAEELAKIDRYTDALQDKLVRVAQQALAARLPGSLAWGEGKAGFATQRRRVIDGKYQGFGVVPDGMADRVLPVLRVTDEHGAVRAIFTSYACHCTTLRGGDNFVHSDWAGEASAQMEAQHDGAVALVALGCGADANPHPRTGIADAVRHGAEIATEVKRVLAGTLRPLGAVTHASHRRIELALDHVVTRAELEQRLEHEAPLIRFTAGKFLQRLDAGATLPTSVPYPVQAWAFGRDLAMVFLGGEVVSGYSLRLRREFDARRLWVNAYANSVPCYIASRQVMDEGGYEVDVSMNFYGWPTQLARDTEERVIRTVHALVPEGFATRR